MSKIFTRKEIKDSVPKELNSLVLKNYQKPIYTIIDNKVYDLSADFFQWHAGGSVALSQLGNDATDAFDAFHAPKTRGFLQKYYVGDLASSDIIEPKKFDKEIRDLITVLKKDGFYDTHSGFYTRKVAEVLGMWTISVSMIYIWQDYFIAWVLSAALLGLFFQQCGWLAHDFCHNQVFTNRKLNSFMGLFLGDVCQGFSVGWWKQKHSTHHSVPNVHDYDPDINTMPLLAWSEHALEFFTQYKTGQLEDFIVSNQSLLFFPFLAFARMAWAYGSLDWVIGQKPRVMDFPTMEGYEKMGLAIHYAWLFLIPLSIKGITFAILWPFMAQVFCGLFLAAVFSLNHNGMPVYTDEEARKMSYFELSIVTGRDVYPSPITDWFMGGLNYQIEHHLFPSMPRHNLKRVAPLIKTLCKKHSIPYHTTSFTSGLLEVVGQLNNISQIHRKKSQ